MVKLKSLAILGREEVLRLEEDVKEKLLEEAVRRTGIPRDRWIIRDILPATDLGLATESWSFDYTAANAENRVISIQLPDRKFIIFFKVAVLDPNPAAVYVKFRTGKTGATIKDVLHLEDLYVLREPEAYLEEPILYTANDWVIIDIYARATKTGERIVLGGYVAELRGETITV